MLTELEKLVTPKEKHYKKKEEQFNVIIYQYAELQ
jgi:hypothetical protein